MGRFITLNQLLPKDVTFETETDGLSEEDRRIQRIISGSEDDDESSRLLEAKIVVGSWDTKIIKIDPEIIDIIEETDIGVILETSSGRSIHVKGDIDDIEKQVEGYGTYK